MDNRKVDAELILLLMQLDEIEKIVGLTVEGLEIGLDVATATTDLKDVHMGLKQISDQLREWANIDDMDPEAVVRQMIDELDQAAPEEMDDFQLMVTAQGIRKYLEGSGTQEKRRGKGRKRKRGRQKVRSFARQMDEQGNTCAWCGKKVRHDVEVFAVGARARAGVDLTDQEGTIMMITLALTNKRVPALVVTSDSPAKKEGKDLAFVACSRRCAKLLKDALRQEVDVFGGVELLH
jgi:hypothetical protein